jgi:hypothetical protein
MVEMEGALPGVPACGCMPEGRATRSRDPPGVEHGSQEWKSEGKTGMPLPGQAAAARRRDTRPGETDARRFRRHRCPPPRGGLLAVSRVRPPRPNGRRRLREHGATAVPGVGGNHHRANHGAPPPGEARRAPDGAAEARRRAPGSGGVQTAARPCRRQTSRGRSRSVASRWPARHRSEPRLRQRRQPWKAERAGGGKRRPAPGLGSVTSGAIDACTAAPRMLVPVRQARLRCSPGSRGRRFPSRYESTR